MKGARVTVTPRGRTYITVGVGGFSYRQNLAMDQHPARTGPRFEPVQPSPILDEIKTADVEELRESSKSELVDNLNRRAAMFNPAILIFVGAALIGFIGVVNLASSLPTVPAALPEVSSPLDSRRQVNTSDEYALLLARYGQPSRVQIAQVGSIPIRNATWDAAHLTVRFVPVGYVEALIYSEAHKNDPPRARPSGRNRRAFQAETAPVPTCTPGVSKASTIIGYEDAGSRASIDALAAGGSLGAMTGRSTIPPTVTVSVPQSPKGRTGKAVTPSTTADYDDATLRKEEQRLHDLDVSTKQGEHVGAACLAGALVLLIPGLLFHRKNKEKRTTQLIYDLSEAAKTQQESMEGSLGHLAQSGAIWRLDSQSAVTDWKRNAGAAYNVQRERVSMRRTTPARVESNVVPLCLDLGKLKLFFLPDQVLYWQRGTFASIEFGDLQVSSSSTRFIEESVQTSDSQQVGSTWRYVRKDGGPDRRFNNNRQLPVMLYGVVHATTAGGLNLIFHTSRPDSATSFQTTFRAFQTDCKRSALPGQEAKSATAPGSDDNPAASTPPGDIVQAMATLGLKRGCTEEEIVAAYRHMAQMYHPDKTAGLGPEIQRLAEQRMQEINAANETVKRYMERS